MCTNLFYAAKKQRKIHIAFLTKITDVLLQILYGIEIHSTMKCGKGLVITHYGYGVVINEKAIMTIM